MSPRHKIKSFIAIATIFTIGAVAVFAIAQQAFDGTPVIIQSLESKTIEQKPVFNKIQYQHQAGRDIWIMQQSHHGLAASAQNWERLAIVVETDSATKHARFFQIKPGDFVFEPEKSVEYRVSCFICHSNGPRAIRPDLSQDALVVSFKDRLKIAMWNLRIKTYGRIIGSGAKEPHVPFRHSGDFDNEPLKSQTCLHCHSETGWVKRGHLTRQNSVAIRFMIKSGFMPPPGFSLSETERRKIELFTLGL